MPRIANLGNLDWFLRKIPYTWDGKPLTASLFEPNLIDVFRLELDELPSRRDGAASVMYSYGNRVDSKALPDNAVGVATSTEETMGEGFERVLKIGSTLSDSHLCVLTVHPYSLDTVVFYEVVYRLNMHRDEAVRRPTNYMIALARSLSRMLAQDTPMFQPRKRDRHE